MRVCVYLPSLQRNLERINQNLTQIVKKFQRCMDGETYLTLQTNFACFTILSRVSTRARTRVLFIPFFSPNICSTLT